MSELQSTEKSLNIIKDEIYGSLREIESNFYRVSLRSNDLVDVSEVAAKFDGGGHTKAAGCDIHYDLETSIKKLVRETNKYL